LPWREKQLKLASAAQVAQAIRTLAIRGAPLIGAAAAYGVAVDLARDDSDDALAGTCRVLHAARPTAVNLHAALERVRRAAELAAPGQRAAAARAEADAIWDEEELASEAIARGGAELLSDVGTLMTHCNTGALAAPGRGTALAVAAELAVRGGLRLVMATETRPLLQGARLTAYELARLEIPYQLIVDGAAAGLIRRREVDAVIVGADRVAANGDVANKVGTYALALAARAAEIPFVVACPTSTIDLECPTGEEITIEERDPEEVRSAAGALLTLPDSACRNPAFDVTPASLIGALVTERGTLSPVDRERLRSLRATGGAR
jgi:methylthioribose-1-phosphate isomerase